MSKFCLNFNLTNMTLEIKKNVNTDIIHIVIGNDVRFHIISFLNIETKTVLSTISLEISIYISL